MHYKYYIIKLIVPLKTIKYDWVAFYLNETGVSLFSPHFFDATEIADPEIAFFMAMPGEYIMRLQDYSHHHYCYNGTAQLFTPDWALFKINHEKVNW